MRSRRSTNVDIFNILIFFSVFKINMVPAILMFIYIIFATWLHRLRINTACFVYSSGGGAGMRENTQLMKIPLHLKSCAYLSMSVSAYRVGRLMSVNNFFQNVYRLYIV